ncbi:MAG: hypothetical protein ACTHK2_16330 [Dokdonella sp.]|uniref:hypothetical protein n=1 Tax=Dokdonella sp. TaxID=2291710 RepID=UPI003F822CE7
MEKTDAKFIAHARGTAPGIRLLPVSAADGYMYPAIDFFFGCRALAGARRGARGFASLAAQSLEAALKCLLVRASFDVNKLKSHQLRHNLVGLWHEAAQLGIAVEPAPPDWCKTLNSGHQSFVFRYTEGRHGYVTPNQHEVLTGLTQVLELIEPGAPDWA